MNDVVASCPVCESQLDFHLWKADNPSHEMCPHCGIQFGYNDARADVRQHIYRIWREGWIANGRRCPTGKAWKEFALGVSEKAVQAAKAG